MLTTKDLIIGYALWVLVSPIVLWFFFSWEVANGPIATGGDSIAIPVAWYAAENLLFNTAAVVTVFVVAFARRLLVRYRAPRR